MFAVKRMWALALCLGAILLVAACGGSSSGVVSSGSGSSGSTPSPTASSAPLVKTASASVGGSSETILTNAQGMTLYYFDPDTTTTAACGSGCTTVWPPLLEGSGSLAAPSGVSGTLSAVNNANGKQVEYNGHPLYTYSGDTAAGQTNGNGIQGKWHVATPNIAVNTGGNNGGNSGY